MAVLDGELSRVGFISSTGAVEYRVSSFFPHPNQLAGFVVLFVPLSVGLYSVFESRLAKAACVLLPLLAFSAAIVTYSRGVLVALVALVLVLARSRRAWPVIAAAAVLVILLSPAAWQDRVADAGRLDRPEIATRLDFWDAAVAMFQAQPGARRRPEQLRRRLRRPRHDGPQLSAREAASPRPSRRTTST